MTIATDWLKAQIPGFNDLSQNDLDAVADFSLLWGLFESRILSSRASASTICGAVESWHLSGSLDPALFDQELAYFKQRYHPQADFTSYFDGLLLRSADRGPMVRAVLSGVDTEPRNRLAAALIIVFRYRNNLFHGMKWEYELADQLGNFTAANAILMKALGRYGI